MAIGVWMANSPQATARQWQGWRCMEMPHFVGDRIMGQMRDQYAELRPRDGEEVAEDVVVFQAGAHSANRRSVKLEDEYTSKLRLSHL
jgi:hypothetical protein